MHVAHSKVSTNTVVGAMITDPRYTVTSNPPSLHYVRLCADAISLVVFSFLASHNTLTKFNTHLNFM